jgi:hypothetical protein
MLWKLNFITNLEFWIPLQSFKQKIENKNICGRETLIDRERHIALEMLTSRTAYVDRERENTPAKTTTRQSLNN